MAMSNVLRGLAKAKLPAAVADGVRVRALMDLYGRWRSAYEDAAGKFIRIGEVDPLSAHYSSKTLDTAALAAATTFYEYVDMDGWRYLCMQLLPTINTDSITMTLEATVQDDGTAPGSCDYEDITLAFTGALSYTDTDELWVIDTPVAFKYVRLVYVTAAGAGDSLMTAHIKKMW